MKAAHALDSFRFSEATDLLKEYELSRSEATAVIEKLVGEGLDARAVALAMAHIAVDYVVHIHGEPEGVKFIEHLTWYTHYPCK